MGRDGFDKVTFFTFANVSIHTPVWGVTCYTIRSANTWSVSIHTPVWGVTIIGTNFPCFKRVSIHTPVWGVT